MSPFLGPVGYQIYLGLRFTFGLKCPTASLLSGAFSVCAQLIYHNLGTASVLSYYPIYTRWEGQGVSVAGANPGVQASSSWYKRLEARGRSKASAGVYQHILPARRAHLMASAGIPDRLLLTNVVFVFPSSNSSRFPGITNTSMRPFAKANQGPGRRGCLPGHTVTRRCLSVCAVCVEPLSPPTDVVQTRS